MSKPTTSVCAYRRALRAIIPADPQTEHGGHTYCLQQGTEGELNLKQHTLLTNPLDLPLRQVNYNLRQGRPAGLVNLWEQDAEQVYLDALALCLEGERFQVNGDEVGIEVDRESGYTVCVRLDTDTVLRATPAVQSDTLPWTISHVGSAQAYAEGHAQVSWSGDIALDTRRWIRTVKALIKRSGASCDETGEGEGGA